MNKIYAYTEYAPAWRATSKIISMHDSDNVSSHDASELLEQAIDSSLAALNFTWECETLCFWMSIDAGDLFIWLCEDQPQLAARIWRMNLLEKYKKRISTRISLMQHAESFVWKHTDNALRAFIADLPTEEQLGMVYAHMEKAHLKFSDDHDYGDDEGDEDEETYTSYLDNRDEVEENWSGGGPGYGAIATEAVAREALRIIVGRNTHATENGQRGYTQQSESWDSDDGCAVIDEIRRCTLSSATNCYVVDREALPQSLRGRTTEHRCLMVKVDDQWLNHPELIANPESLCYHLVDDGDSPIPIPAWGFANKVLWLRAEIFLEPIRRFRSALPVLYVGSTRCRLVIHRFAHWADLHRLVSAQRAAEGRPQYRESIEVNSFKTELPDGTVLHPSLKRNLVDLSGG
ncbi:hypothetical protein PQR33_05755 [Paraburkholderia sediminicola]|uniref:hypothetical protein n=1 Tax=Paraburkholderia sediminicola TaxID=458836 RepID=UPI0038B8DA71